VLCSTTWLVTEPPCCGAGTNDTVINAVCSLAQAGPLNAVMDFGLDSEDTQSRMHYTAFVSTTLNTCFVIGIPRKVQLSKKQTLLDPFVLAFTRRLGSSAAGNP
jgi:hypothetical protein